MDTQGAYPSLADRTDNLTGTTDSTITLATFKQTSLEVAGGIVYKEGKVGNTSIIRTMAKGQNSVSCSRTLDFVGHEEGEKSVFIMIDDLFERKDSSEFMGWIYDADFEFLNTPEMKQVILAGPRCYDYKLRLLIAGLPEEKILCEEDEFKAVALIDKNVSNFYLLHDTSTYDLACEVEEKIIADFKAFNENGGKQ
jgi:hypothetical protein